MKRTTIIFVVTLFPSVFAYAQNRRADYSAKTEIAFVSDTQQPMWFEKILLRPNHNRKATAMLFSDILRQKPNDLYMLGDVVALGYSNRKWVNVDKFLDSCHLEGIRTYGLLGNHDVMGRPMKGAVNFQKRFPAHVRTGYVSIVDSVAVVLLNSNFGYLSATDVPGQQKWYESTMADLDADKAIKGVIVACHHAPYSNSKVVGSSKPVQAHFVPAFIHSKKAVLFITGHSHAFEYFKIQGKDFLVIGGGGGLHQPLDSSRRELQDITPAYKPMFHYIKLEIYPNHLHIISRKLESDFSRVKDGFSFDIGLNANE